ncbi:MAG: hypothetical protein H7267_08830 [Sandarakinorhabdus sp.]|nr:hypothetical protein [Sandarakinorhabdus sp.]
MTDEQLLFKHTIAPYQGAGFVATRDGGFAIFEPLTPKASDRLQSNVGDNATWLGESLIIEMRYFANLAGAVIAAGFLFERNTLLN